MRFVGVHADFYIHKHFFFNAVSDLVQDFFFTFVDYSSHLELSS